MIILSTVILLFISLCWAEDAVHPTVSPVELTTLGSTVASTQPTKPPGSPLGLAVKAVMSTNTRYARWPVASNIPYVFDSSYSKSLFLIVCQHHF